MIIKNFQPFVGQHCETTATGNLLKQIGLEFSEPMLFGLGEGLGFIFWNMKTMDFPFIGGRVKPGAITHHICQSLGLDLEMRETSSAKKAWDNIVQYIDKGKAVGLKLDCYYLDYFTNKFHFAGHYAALYGYDDAHAFLVDTAQQGCKVKTSLNSLAMARAAKGPMSSKNRSYTIHATNNHTDMEVSIRNAIRNNALEFIHPPIQNIGYKGIQKTAHELKKWYKSSDDVKRDFQTTAMLMEKAGTGGSLFRNLYRDFLLESAKILGSSIVEKGVAAYAGIAADWKRVSELFYKIGEGYEPLVHEASQLLLEIAEKERKAMEDLSRVC